MENTVLRPVCEDDLEMVMDWRMRPEITKYMNTDPVLTLEKQREWYRKVTGDDTTYQWIIEVEGKAIGLTGISGIDRKNGRCTRGTYIAEKEKSSLKLIIDIYSTQFDFIFFDQGLNKIEVEVFKENSSVVRLNKMFGFQEEGLLRQHVKKNGTYHDIVQLGMTKADWEEKKKTWKYDKVKIILPDRKMGFESR